MVLARLPCRPSVWHTGKGLAGVPHSSRCPQRDPRGAPESAVGRGQWEGARLAEGGLSQADDWRISGDKGSGG